MQFYPSHRFNRKVENILKELHLEGLQAQFRREIVPSTILALTDEQIERLGISAIESV